MTFYRILSALWEHGRECAPRGLKVRELIDFHYMLPPRVRFICFDHRKLKLDYIKQEFVWYLRGDRLDVSIKHIAKMWDGLINVNGTINSNYGYYIFNPAAGDGARSNFERVVQELESDPASRRAAMCILDNGHLNSTTRDYPCTSYLNFHIRDNTLHMYVRMRSQDAIFGMGNDAPCFSFVHEMVWGALLRRYPHLVLGNYHHTSDSFHVYERHYEMMEKILCEPRVTVDHHETCPHMAEFMGQGTPGLELEYVQDLALAHPQAVGAKIREPFAAWLFQRDDPSTILPLERAWSDQ